MNLVRYVINFIKYQYKWFIRYINFYIYIQGFKASTRYITEDNDEADLYSIEDTLIPESTEFVFDSLLKNENEKIRQEYICYLIIIVSVAELPLLLLLLLLYFNIIKIKIAYIIIFLSFYNNNIIIVIIFIIFFSKILLNNKNKYFNK